MYYLTGSVVQFEKLESCADGTHAFQILPTTTEVLCPSSSALLEGPYGMVLLHECNHLTVLYCYKNRLI